MTAPGPLVLLASARPDGNTGRAADRLANALADVGTVVIDIAALDIRPFDYCRNRDAAFDALIARIGEHPTLVFATPVYWYAMSGALKTVFDRLSDLLVDRTRRPQARALAGKSSWLLATGTDPELPVGFEVPFARTSAYLGWRWMGSHYVQASGDEPLNGPALTSVDGFAEAIRADHGTIVVNR